MVTVSFHNIKVKWNRKIGETLGLIAKDEWNMRTPKRQNYTSLYNYLLSYHQIFDHEFGKFTHFYKKEKIVEDIVIKNI